MNQSIVHIALVVNDYDEAIPLADRVVAVFSKKESLK